MGCATKRRDVLPPRPPGVFTFAVLVDGVDCLAGVAVDGASAMN